MLRWRNKAIREEEKITSTPYRRMQMAKSLQNKKYGYVGNFQVRVNLKVDFGIVKIGFY